MSQLARPLVERIVAFFLFFSLSKNNSGRYDMRSEICIYILILCRRSGWITVFPDQRPRVTFQTAEMLIYSEQSIGLFVCFLVARFDDAFLAYFTTLNRFLRFPTVENSSTDRFCFSFYLFQSAKQKRKKILFDIFSVVLFVSLNHHESFGNSHW